MRILLTSTLLVTFIVLSTSTDCIQTETKCSCSQKQAETELCLELLDRNSGTCGQGTCGSVWKCGCEGATHICDIVQCSEESLQAISQNNSSSDPRTSPSPVASSSLLTSCNVSNDCSATQYCILGKCRELGSCDDDMNNWCESQRSGSKCCVQNSPCALINFNDDVSICSQSCEEFCFHTGGFVDCAFQNRSAGVGFLEPGTPSFISFTMPACSVVT